MAGGGSSNPYDNVRLLYSPTWAIAFTTFVFVFISLIVERAFFFFGQKLKKGKSKDLEEAFEKIKEELMMVGFISLALTIGQESFAKICVPTKWIKVMHQCNDATLLKKIIDIDSSTCAKGKSHFVSITGLHQLHIFLFMLVVVHVFISVITMAIARWKVHLWKYWEPKPIEPSNTHVLQFDNQNNDNLTRFTKETTFVSDRTRNGPLLTYVFIVFRQFFRPISKADYETLRHGFIKNHLPNNAIFDFHRYMLRTLNDDFKDILGVSPLLWGYLILWILANVDGWEAYIATSILPILLLFIIGVELQHIITKMAIEIPNKHVVTQGYLPSVMLRDEHFWFKSPKLILHSIHFILFQVAITISMQLWGLYYYRKNKTSCLFHNNTIVASSLILGIISLAFCAYVTIPTYALVSQMGTRWKSTIFAEDTHQALIKWKQRAQKEASNHVPTDEVVEARHEIISSST